MRASLSHPLQRSREDLQQLLAWYKIRDTLLGQNEVKQALKKALELAALCEHPNAVWLTKLFAGRDVNTPDEASQVFLGCERDPRSLCFAALLVGSYDEIHRAADLGDAYAQAVMAARFNDEEGFRLGQKSAAQGERDGFFWLGLCYRCGAACDNDIERSKENYLTAAELGCVGAMFLLGELFEKTDPKRFVWMGKAAANGQKSELFLNEMEEQIRNFDSGPGLSNIIFAIDRVLKGHIDNEEREIFGTIGNLTLSSVLQTELFNFTIFNYYRIEKQSTVGPLSVFVTKLSRTYENDCEDDLGFES
jgi:hypothetical protein